ncbi:MAG: Bug family tripartite tricarboxylate transporter substrate binding protein [bacterium]
MKSPAGTSGRSPIAPRRRPRPPASPLAVAMAAVLLIGLPLAMPGNAGAQAFPSKPVRWVVPYAPGGNTDMIARVIGARMSETLGQQVVVENRAGAATLIGAEYVARAAPDGHTMLLATSTTLAINPHLYRKLPYDPVADFAPITLIARVAMVLVTHPSLPAKTAKELVALAKARPGQIANGTQGLGSPSYMASELFKSAAGISLIDVPYKGSGPAVPDLMGGQIAMLFDNTSLNFVRAGRLRAIAHTGEKRLAVAPEVPTMVESGFPGVVFYSWQGVVAPAKTPPDMVARLNAEVVRALKLADVQSKITAEGAEILAVGPREFGDYIRSEIVRFGKVIRDAGVKPE